MKTISGYVYQEDLFIETLTVKEHLHFMVVNSHTYYGALKDQEFFIHSICPFLGQNEIRQKTGKLGTR
jgi:ABC-type multidrug transport system ATPase subunit